MKTTVIFRSLSPIIAFFLLCSCSKDPEVIIQTETVTIIDTVTITDTVTVIETIVEAIQDTTTTFILVRHAETSSGSNPNLSAAGQARVAELQRILEHIPLNAVYSTNLNRTLQTATPVATEKGLSVQTYDPFAPDVLIDEVLVTHRDGIVLIVGHSNTTPAFVNTLIGAQVYDDIPETEYDNLFLVHAAEKGRAKVVQMKYGE